MTHSENYWKLYLDSKKNSEPVSVSFNEKDNSVSLMATRRLVDILTASGVLDGETHLLNPAYKSMSDDELRCQLNELLYTNTGKKSYCTVACHSWSNSLQRFYTLICNLHLSCYAVS